MSVIELSLVNVIKSWLEDEVTDDGLDVPLAVFKGVELNVGPSKTFDMKTFNRFESKANH